MNRKLRGALRSRTMWLGLALTLAGAAQAHLYVFQAYLTPQGQGWLTMAAGVAVAALRWATTLPLDDK